MPATAILRDEGASVPMLSEAADAVVLPGVDRLVSAWACVETPTPVPTCVETPVLALICVGFSKTVKPINSSVFKDRLNDLLDELDLNI